ncbi:hypothetical protein F5Y15DRAFT_414276 [Xylariaceae sp. FL0016]|nr:hypothetical protein F5Y15DRAFT_414276 [Xylariaceae sp. FL0016]
MSHSRNTKTPHDKGKGNASSTGNTTGNDSSPGQAAGGIIQLGQGVAHPGDTPENQTTHAPMCYQCCKQVSLRRLANTYGDNPCGPRSCERARAAGYDFIPMPPECRPQCETFQTYVDYWVHKMAANVSQEVERRARAFVHGARDAILWAPPSGKR